MAVQAALIVSKRLQIVAAVLLCLMLAQLARAALETPPRSNASGVVRVRMPLDLSRTGR
jgi:hypothetical protein